MCTINVTPHGTLVWDKKKCTLLEGGGGFQKSKFQTLMNFLPIMDGVLSLAKTIPCFLSPTYPIFYNLPQISPNQILGKICLILPFVHNVFLM